PRSGPASGRVAAGRTRPCCWSGRRLDVGLGQHGCALLLGQRAPPRVGLTGPEGVRAALLQHGALEAEFLGTFVAPAPGRTAFALGMEEQLRTDRSAQSFELPVPLLGNRTRSGSHISHQRHLTSLLAHRVPGRASESPSVRYPAGLVRSVPGTVTRVGARPVKYGRTF